MKDAREEVRRKAREALIDQLKQTSDELVKKVAELYDKYSASNTADLKLAEKLTNSDILRGLAVYALSEGAEPNQEGTGAFIAGFPVLFGTDEDTDKRIHLGVVNDGIPVFGADINGNVFMGSDIQDAATTAWALFSIAQTYNSESMGAGDILFGDNSAGKANILWDVSEGRLKFRGGTTTTAYIDTDGTLVTTSATIGGWTINSTTIQKLVSSVGIILDSANQIIKVGDTSGTHIQIDGANKRIRSSNYVAGSTGMNIDADTGDAEFGKLTARGEMLSAVMVNSAVGENLLILPADVLDVDMTAEDNSTLTIKGKITLAVGDILWMKDETDEEWLEVTNAASAPTYTVTRDKASAYAENSNPAWKAGQAVVNYMQSGDGGIKITSGATPKISCFTNAGSPWSSTTEQAYMSEDGVLAGAGKTKLDINGLTMLAGASENPGSMVKWKNEDGDLYVSITTSEPDADQWRMYIRIYDTGGSMIGGIILQNDGIIHISGSSGAVATFDTANETFEVFGRIKNHWKTVVKIADESRASTTTLTNDGELLFTPQASGVYAFRGRIFFNTSAIADFKWRIQAGTVTRLYLRWKYVIPGTTTEMQGIETASPTTVTAITGVGTTAGYIEFDGIVTETETAADVRFQWAQNTSDAGNTTVLAGSYIAYCLAE